MNKSVEDNGYVTDFIRYLTITSLLMFVCFVYNMFWGDESYGFWASLLMFIFYSIVPAIGCTIGNILRKIAMPMFIITDGGMGSLLKARAFWAYGPQLIGWVLGLFLAIEMLQKWFGIVKN